MCTILTLDRDTFLADRREVTSRILRDAQNNSDGLSLIAVDPFAPTTNFSMNCMAVGHVLNLIDMFFSSSSEYSRIWLHLRAATTDFVGIPFNHGFTDSRGTMIQHNGVVYNYRDLGVDSFNLSDYRTDCAHKFRDDLDTALERFANVFLIRPEKSTYGVVHMVVGSLHTDGQGNYSTHPVADIALPVDERYAREYSLIPRAATADTSVYGDWEDTISAWDAVLDKKYLKAE
jgi:hypothetical protein